MQTCSLRSLAAAGRDLGAALHSSCKAPSASEANHWLSRNFVSPLPQRTLRVLCGDVVIREIWVKTLTLLKSWACVHGCMIRVIQLLPLVFPCRRKEFADLQVVVEAVRRPP